MKSYDWMQTADANNAGWAATRGALMGAGKWGAVAAVLGLVGQMFSPLYKGMTIQFKLYIQSSVMVLGGMIEADWRLREYEARVRMQRRIEKDRARWRRYEEEFLESPPTSTPTPVSKDEGGK